MQLTQFKPFLILIFCLTILFGCNNNDSRNVLTTGDREAVDIYVRIRPSDLPLVSENINNGFNWTTFSKLLDVNDDESFDFALAYVQQTNISGDANYYTSIIKFNSSLEILGTEGELFGNTVWTATMFEAGEQVDLDAAEWRTFESDLFLAYQSIETGVETTNYNLFPIPESEGYFFWRMTDLDDRKIAGWLHLEQTDDNYRPLVLDAGFKFLD